MNPEESIANFEKSIVEVYKQYNLTSLRGLDHSFMVNGRQILEWHLKVISEGKNIYGSNFDFQKNFDDLIFCSDEILYFIGNMYLYRPFMNNPLKEGVRHGDHIVYPYNQNKEAKRYSMFGGVVSEKIYNYWDRVGDLLAAYFPGLLEAHQVFFPKVIELIPEEYHGNENYLWLKSFKENEYVELNKKRKQFVHYTTMDTEIMYEHLKNPTDKKKVDKLVQKRDAQVDFYKTHIDLTLKGHENLILLIKDITERTIPLK